MTQESFVKSGWYADPQNPAFVRYWDGARWTEHISIPPRREEKFAERFERFNEKTDVYNYLPPSARKIVPPLFFFISSLVTFMAFGLITGTATVIYIIIFSIPTWLLSFREENRFWYSLKRQALLTIFLTPGAIVLVWIVLHYGA